MRPLKKVNGLTLNEVKGLGSTYKTMRSFANAQDESVEMFFNALQTGNQP